MCFHDFVLKKLIAVFEPELVKGFILILGVYITNNGLTSITQEKFAVPWYVKERKLTRTQTIFI